MKTTHLSLIILFLIFSPILPNAIAQDYTTWGLPDDAMARLGKGKITGNIAFTPDGNRLAAAGSIGIWIYDVRPGKEKELELLTGHTGEVTFITFSHDGKLLASGGKDGTVRLWDVVTGEEKKQLIGHKWTISSLAFAPDGKTLASAIGHEAEMIPPQIGVEIDIKLWNIDIGEVTATFRGHAKDITSLAFSHDGETLVSSGKDRKVLLWDISTGKSTPLLTEHKRNVIFVGFSPDGKTIATGSSDDTVKLWDATIGSLKNTIIEPGTIGVSSVAFSPKDAILAVGGYSSTIRLWDLEKKTCIRTFKGHKDNVPSIAFSPDGNTLATAGDASDSAIMLWDLRAAKHRTTIKEHTSAVTCLTFSPDGKTIASGGRNGDGYLWDAQTGEHKATLKEHYDGMHFITYTSDGSTIITGGQDMSVHLWEGRQRLLQTRTRKPKSSIGLTTTSGVSRIHSMAYSPDGNFIAATGRNKWDLILWNARTGRRVNVHSNPSHRSWRVVFSPDGSILAEADHTLKIRLWDPQKRQITKTLILHGRFQQRNTHMAFSADGKLLANTREEDTVQIWDVASGKEVALMKMPESGVTKVQFSPNGALIATGFRDGTLHIFSRHTAEHLGGYKGHTDGISALTFSPDSRAIASGSDDGTILIWELR